ncbi:MAG: zinc ribbon domain-containing protein [Tannerellaceae bacterium]|nr:zinc ribbon domain-containing protein [Tannerellaceae bacterium]
MELFEAVQRKKLSRNTQADKSNKHITILSKLIKCPKCGLFLGGDYRNRNGYIAHCYRCTRRNTVSNCEHTHTYSMVQLDSAIWAFVKENVSELVEAIESYYTNLDLNKIGQEIENLKEKLIKLDNRKTVESNIYRTSGDSDPNDGLIEYRRKIAMINKEKGEIKLLIEEKESMIIQATNRITEHLQEEICNQINKIENSKQLLHKYIHLLITSIIPIYSDRNFTVLEIYSAEDMGESFNENLELIKNTVTIKYYLIINKRDNHRIKLRLIDNPNITFENDSFCSNGIYTKVSEIFNLQLVNTLEEPFLSMDTKVSKFMNNLIHTQIKELQYNRLDVYAED